jgi:hypothetical protein
MGLEVFTLKSLEKSVSKEMQQHAIKALENGKVLYFPHMPFKLKQSEKCFLSPTKTDPKSKNISFDLRTGKVGGTTCQGEEALRLQEMMKRYADYSRHLMHELFPEYIPHMIQARTSYRPVETAGRQSSYRKDDTRLHVDAFPSSPTKGQRILRMFTNVNPYGKPRVWRLGEPFADVVSKMAPKVSTPLPGLASLLKMLKITKDYRTLYDHYMLHMHDLMKGDLEYQKNVPQMEVKFPPGSTWIVYTDQVSHAAMSGQFMFTQDWNVPEGALHDQSTSPLRVLEKFLNKTLV